MPNTITDKTTKPVLIRDNGEYIIPITDSRYVQYHNSNLGGTYDTGGGVSPVNWTVANVEEALDVIANKPMIGDVFEVIFTVNASTGAITADKTFTELETAWIAKKLIVGKIVSSGPNFDVWGNSTLNAIKPNLLSCTYGDYHGESTFFFCNITSTSDTIMSLDLRYGDDGTISVVDQGTKEISLNGHIHSTLTHGTATTTKLYVTGVTGTTNQQPKYDSGVYLTTTAGELRATTFNEGGTTLASKYAPLLKYTVKAASSSSATFNSSSKMQPNTVYVIGSGSNPFSFTAINSVVLASGSTSFLANDIGMLWSAGQASITSNMTVPMYQMIFRGGTSGVSFTMPSSVKWKDGSAPDPRATSSKMCELTIINDIATINII